VGMEKHLPIRESENVSKFRYSKILVFKFSILNFSGKSGFHHPYCYCRLLCGSPNIAECARKSPFAVQEIAGKLEEEEIARDCS
jgi:hypothetical protein